MVNGKNINFAADGEIVGFLSTISISLKTHEDILGNQIFQNTTLIS